MIIGRPAADFLKSIGFKFSTAESASSPHPGYSIDELIDSRHHRMTFRQQLGPTGYGVTFETIVEQLLLSRFNFDVLRGVKIEEEGTGGDYDLLAFQSPYLHYIECKTGQGKNFNEIFARHQFLAPSSTIIVSDESKEVVRRFVFEEVQPVLTAWSKEKDQNLAKREGYKYAIEEISPSGSSDVIFHTCRNIFVASGEELDRAFRRVLRYLHQVVFQSSYWA